MTGTLIINAILDSTSISADVRILKSPTGEFIGDFKAPFQVNLPAGEYYINCYYQGLYQTWWPAIEEGIITTHTFYFYYVPTTPGIKLWDTMERYTLDTDYGEPFIAENRRLWKQVPYGVINWVFTGTPILETETQYYVMHSGTMHSPHHFLKYNGYASHVGEIYNIWYTPVGTKAFSSGIKYLIIIKNTLDEIEVEWHGDVYQEPYSTEMVFRVVVKKNTYWLKFVPVKDVHELGLHFRSRYTYWPMENFVLDSKFAPSASNIGYVSPINKLLVAPLLHNDCLIVSSWISPYSMGTEWNYEIMLGPWPAWWESIQGELLPSPTYPHLPIVDSIRIFHNTRENHGGMPIIVSLLPSPYEKIYWHYQYINKQYSEGDTVSEWYDQCMRSPNYGLSWQPKINGIWRVLARINGEYQAQDIDVMDNTLRFRMPQTGTLENALIYLHERNVMTPANTFSVMDVYREAVIAPDRGILECTAKFDTQEVEAFVEIVGVGIYKTPLSLELDIGTYHLVASYQDLKQEKDIVIESAKKTVVEFDFAKQPPTPWGVIAVAGLILASVASIFMRKGGKK